MTTFVYRDEEGEDPDADALGEAEETSVESVDIADDIIVEE